MLDYSRTDYPECAALSSSVISGGWCAKRGRGVVAAQCHDCQRQPTKAGPWFEVEIVTDPFPTARFRAYSAGTRAYVRTCIDGYHCELFSGNYQHGAQLLSKAECRQYLRLVKRADERTQARLNEAYRQSLQQ